MKDLGISCKPVGYGEAIYRQQFLLSSDEANELTGRLRKTPLDKKEIYESLLPKNLPIGDLSLDIFDINSMKHQELNQWSANYKFSPRKNLSLYPVLDFTLDSSDEGNVLSVSPHVRMFFQLRDRKNDCDSLGPGSQREILDLIGSYFERDRENLAVCRERRFDTGWSVAPMSLLENFCYTVSGITEQLSSEDVKTLVALSDTTKKHERESCYSEAQRRINEFVENALNSKHYQKQLEIIKRVKHNVINKKREAVLAS